MEHNGSTNYGQIWERIERGLPGGEFIQSERLLSLLDEVWLRLPELDRHVLEETLGVITDHPDMRLYTRKVLGSASWFMGEVGIDGVGCVLPEDAKVFLASEKLDRLSDLAASAVIAHELAHIILRHHSLISPFAVLEDLRAEELAKLEEVHEWEADLQVWLWGLTAELRSLWEETRRDPPPWYHQVDECGG